MRANRPRASASGRHAQARIRALLYAAPAAAPTADGAASAAAFAASVPARVRITVTPGQSEHGCDSADSTDSAGEVTQRARDVSRVAAHDHARCGAHRVGIGCANAAAVPLINICASIPMWQSMTERWRPTCSARRRREQHAGRRTATASRMEDCRSRSGPRYV